MLAGLIYCSLHSIRSKNTIRVHRLLLNFLSNNIITISLLYLINRLHYKSIFTLSVPMEQRQATEG